MRTINKALIAAAIPAIAIAAPAQAQVGGGQITGVVPAVCEVQDLFASISFPDMNAGTTLSDGVTLTCNDVDGATVTLISSEGGMESDDNEDEEIEYQATLTSGVLAAPLVLDTTGAFNNDVSASTTIAGSPDLAAGAAGTLEIELLESASWAGGYSDTITVQLTAS
ncbi:hypothetical protein [Erythrobacter rubeus]|uniref:Spore coat protein U domain-containing protein n=1 Tax=Erythrobacter rubeus TaxID=2760803 RepID=A0ABR8KKZ6_9SPHN|nr:hypothetical protein [Erythrobacter rubeus]MBD2840996.1 hypothetical protein [Erythrobacter rubeus]